MAKAGIISIGNEVLTGQSIDTNAAFLGKQLLQLGIVPVRAYTVPDEVGSIVGVLRTACEDCDVILLTGGLGPTADDVTRQALAEFLQVGLVLDTKQAVRIRRFFAGRGLPMPEKAVPEAYIPAGVETINNRLGTAAGIMAEKGGKLFIAMPGVPAEMKPMFRRIAAKKLAGLASAGGRQAIVCRKINCFGAGESTIAGMLGAIMQRDRNPQVNCTVDCGLVSLYIVAIAPDGGQARRMADKDRRHIRRLLGGLVVGSAEQTLAEVVGKKLAAKRKTIAVAESCTGGLLAKLLTDVPGSSRYFVQGWVAYSNRAKTSQLGVPAGLIEEFGAVSEQVAQAMARSARKIARTDFGIGITGTAGPAGGTKQKPVGLVHICVNSQQKSENMRFIFPGDRDSIRMRASLTALDVLRRRFTI